MNKLQYCSTKELLKKEIINKYDGKKLGCAKYFTIDLNCGNLISMTFNAPGSGMFCKADDMITVAWCDIEKIGEDVIIVCLPSAKPKKS
jgi:YlmC/YmxH family sporulation protein